MENCGDLSRVVLQGVKERVIVFSPFGILDFAKPLNLFLFELSWLLSELEKLFRIQRVW